MAKISELTVALGKTINLGNYESKRVDVSFTARLDEGDSEGEVFGDLISKARSGLQGAIDNTD